MPPDWPHESSLTNLMASSVYGCNFDLKWICTLELFQLHSYSRYPPISAQSFHVGEWSAKAARLTVRVDCEDVCELHPGAVSFLNCASAMVLMRFLEFGARFLLLFWIWQQTCSQSGDSELSRGSTGRWSDERNRSLSPAFLPLLVMMGPAVRRAFPDAAGGGLATSRLRRRPQIWRVHHSASVLAEVTCWRGLADLWKGITGMSRMQSSGRHSLVTQCRNTVDIFWCRCLTNRKTSKEKRPVWLLPFSKTVVCGSLLHLQNTHRWAYGDA